MISGSTLWQMVFISFAVVLILFEVVRGWRRGVARQLARLGALIAAYFAAYYAGGLVAPFLRPVLKMPDAILSIVAGALLALIVYAVINGLGVILFKRTRQHQSGVIRFFYGLSGAAIGLFFGAFLVWVVVFGIRSLGSVAEAQVREQAPPVANSESRAVHAVDLRRRPLAGANEESATLMTSLARLKNSLELGSVGDAVKKADVVPAQTYEMLGKIGTVASDPESLQRFLSFPMAHELSEHPKIVALRNDPEIAELVTQGRYLDLLQNEKVLDALNDRDLVEQIKKFDVRGALDYALQKQ